MFVSVGVWARARRDKSNLLTGRIFLYGKLRVVREALSPSLVLSDRRRCLGASTDLLRDPLHHGVVVGDQRAGFDYADDLSDRGRGLLHHEGKPLIVSGHLFEVAPRRLREYQGEQITRES